MGTKIEDTAFRKELYFFYGSLMDSSTLARVLRLRELPELRPAKIVGYHCKLWGPYPALVDGPSDATVHGTAYEVQSPAERERLEWYETYHYKNSACSIELEDGRMVAGRTFKWNEDPALLEEGTFDLNELQMSSVWRRLHLS
jgi:gamma-glutamylcyclotransferase (GGCT)/AIG2-like uncharacterized protein YtfP